MAEKILVVDDDLDTLRLVGLMLERQGFAIVAATSGQQALSLAKAEKPALILLDLMMPDIDGVDVARRLRADPETRDMFIIMFTAKTQTEDKLEGFEAGADAYLTKPIQPRELVANVKAVLQRSATVSGPAPRTYTEQGEVIAVLAAKGGLGVTTVAANLGVALHNASHKSVLVADFRPGSGSLALDLGENNAQGLTELLRLAPIAITPDAVERKLSEHPSGVRFLFASARPADAALASEVEAFEAIAAALRQLARHVILDLGEGLNPVAEQVLPRCQQVILVVEPVSQTLLQSRLLYESLLEKGFAESAITVALVNRLRAGMQLSLGQAQDEFGRPISLVFTAAPELAYQALTSRQPMVLRQGDGVTAAQFAALAQKVLQRVRT